MMTEIELDQRVQRAVDNFMAGYGCCQSVVAAFSDLYGLDETMAKRIGAGFGGGVGRLRMMCGAVSGIVMLVGLDCGNSDKKDRPYKEEALGANFIHSARCFHENISLNSFLFQ